MEKTGILHIVGWNSRLNDTPLAHDNGADPFSAATTYLRKCGFADGDRICVTGRDGQVGNVDVIFVESAAAA